MGDASKIEWTDATWNATRGCSEVTPECELCYAKGIAARFSGQGLPFEGLAKRSEKRGLPQWTGEVAFIPEMLDQPLRWKRPRRIFVNSMSDLFHEKLSNEQIAAVFGVMAAAPQHTFQVLTKRPARALEWFAWARGPFTEQQRGIVSAPSTPCALLDAAFEFGVRKALLDPAWYRWRDVSWHDEWPLPNVHLYVSAGTQRSADEFVPILLKVPAAIRGVSAEPLLGPVDFSRWLYDQESETDLDGRMTHRGLPGLDHVIVGGESGPGARPCALEWIERIVEQCRAAEVPVFVKQLGACVVSEVRTATLDVFQAMDAAEGKDRRTAESMAAWRSPDGEYWAWRAGLKSKKGSDPDEWPAEFRVRQMPEVTR